MSKSSHSFSVDIAAQEGLIEAILLQHVHFLQTSFVEKDQSPEDVWIKRSVKAYRLTYPYLTAKQITGAFSRMEERDLMRSKIDNKVSYDRTKSVQVARKGWLYFKANAFDEKANGIDEKANGIEQKGKSFIGNYSSFVDSVIEGEGTPTPEPQNLKGEKNKSGLVAPGRADDSKIEALRQLSDSLLEGLKEEVSPLPKVAPKGISPIEKALGEFYQGGSYGENGYFEATAIASPTDLPSVTLVEAVPKRIEAWEHPNPTSPKELKGVLLRYADQDPDNWRDNVLEAGRATNLPLEKIDECLTDFCTWQFKTDFTKAKLSQYTAAFSLWLKRQKEYDAQVGKQVVNGNGQPSAIASVNRKILNL